MDRLLIVNADDFGIHKDVNEGIIQAFRKGIVRSTSLMINMPAANDAVSVAKQYSELEVGLHLNISTHFCLSPRNEVDLICGNDGRFLFDGDNMADSMKCLRQRIQTEPTVIEQIKREFQSQLEVFLQAGLPLGHINIHHYLALLHPRLFAAYVHLAEQAGVPFRALCHPIIEIMSTPDVDVREMVKIAEASQVPSPNHSISNLQEIAKSRSLSANEYEAKVFDELNKVARRDSVRSVEIITHPSMITPNVHQLDNYLWARKLETGLVTSESFASATVRLGFQTGGYQALN